ncbi:hypothetical protein [Caldanaerobacter subterraneus]|uniref:Uncharacterized protein n=1 Tax=Caldanaerobacter subterraneus TaxID=911092 RepID=A0A7Y2L8G9_9THEO|nr:hypothetical protein [Caldanaerobacter subterraneus]NNG67550.1 hypothetical protein [Caldanaerobacter subterraneus]
MRKFLLMMSVIPIVLWSILGLAVVFGFYTPSRETIALLYFTLAVFSWTILMKNYLERR